MSVVTALPPADSPNTVTGPGWPPNAAVLSRTHSSAATWSRSPRLLSTDREGEACPVGSRKPSARWFSQTWTRSPRRTRAWPRYSPLREDPIR